MRHTREAFFLYNLHDSEAKAAFVMMHSDAFDWMH